MSQPKTSLATYSDVASSRTIIGVEETVAPVVRGVVATWSGLRRGRAYPRWEDMAPRDFGKALKNLLVLRVVGDCEDYEFRIAGEAHTKVLGIAGLPKKLSQLDDYVPGYAAGLKPLYDRLVRSREPYALRSEIKRSNDSIALFSSESAFLPLGPSETVVDHVLVASFYRNDGITLTHQD